MGFLDVSLPVHGASLSEEFLCSCLKYAEYRRGEDFGPYPRAKDVPVYDIEPRAGLTLFTNESPLGHASHIEKVEDGLIYRSQTSSWGKTRCTYWESAIPIDSPLIRGVR